MIAWVMGGVKQVAISSFNNLIIQSSAECLYLTVNLTNTTKMGKGDKKTGKGKRFMGSRGKTRPKKASKSTAPVKGAAKKKAPAKKAKKA